MSGDQWYHRSMVVYDLETTGVNPFNDRIVTACAAIFPDVERDPRRTPIPFEWLADPGIEIPMEATRVHGISTDHARQHGRPEAEVVGELAGMLAAMMTEGIPVVGQNVPFDMDFIEQACLRHGLVPLSQRGGGIFPVVDAWVLDMHVEPYRKGSRNLSTMAAHYKVPLEAAHNSTADAVAAGRVVWKIANTYPEIGGMTLGQLHAAQVGWKAEQAAGRNAYWAKIGALNDDGSPRVMSAHWPAAPLGVLVP